MRKSYKKARWRRMAARAKKRGDMVIFGFKKLPPVEAPKYPFTWEGLLKCLADLGYEYKE